MVTFFHDKSVPMTSYSSITVSWIEISELKSLTDLVLVNAYPLAKGDPCGFSPIETAYVVIMENE